MIRVMIRLLRVRATAGDGFASPILPKIGAAPQQSAANRAKRKALPCIAHLRDGISAVDYIRPGRIGSTLDISALNDIISSRFKRQGRGKGKMRRKGLGPHLVLDGYECNREKLADLDVIYAYLEELPDRIEMTKISPPFVTRYTAGKPEDWGISGFVIIAESHISIHTFPEKLYLSVDVFSCKPFDPEVAIRITKEWFEIGRVDYRVFERGRDFPHNIFASARLLDEERGRVLSLSR